MQISRWWLFSIIYMGAIFGFSSIPSDDIPSCLFPFFDKIAHLVEYTGLGWLLNNAFNGLKLAAILTGSLYGLSDEIHQLFTPGRECDFKDLLCDIAGCILGQFIGLLAWWKSREKNNPLTPFIKGE
ncbi:MAG: VanZ family protein [bacterium]|nr:VanZ family protein [bacterium]